MDFKKIFDTKKIKEKLDNKNKKNYIGNLFVLILIGLLLALGSSIFKDTKTAKVTSDLPKDENIEQKIETSSENEQEEAKSNEEKDIENNLKNTLENIQGVGKVKVMVYFKGGEEQIPAINVNDSTSTTEEKDTQGGTRKVTQKNDGRTIVMMNTGNGTKPFVVKKYKPKVTGVCIVAEGAKNNLIKLQIHKATVNLFSLKENEVNVYPMKK